MGLSHLQNPHFLGFLGFRFKCMLIYLSLFVNDASNCLNKEGFKPTFFFIDSIIGETFFHVGEC
jgi:hypothetical protein